MVSQQHHESIIHTKEVSLRLSAEVGTRFFFSWHAIAIAYSLFEKILSRNRTIFGLNALYRAIRGIADLLASLSPSLSKIC